MIAAENSKLPIPRPIAEFSSDFFPPPASRRNLSNFQSSHPAIEIPPNLKKTMIEEKFNRHTFALIFVSNHLAHCHAQLLALLPLRLFASEFPFWPGSPKPQGEGGYSTHPGGSIPPNLMKTLIERFSTRHTSRKGDSAGALKAIQEGEEKANRYTWKLEIR